MFKKSLKLAILMLAVILCQASSANAASITSTFDSGFDGWSSTDGVASLSNPGGYLRVKDLSSSWLFAIAPDKFSGDWANFDSISADLRGETYKSFKRPVAFEISNDGNTARHDFSTSDMVNGEWRTLSTLIDPNDWSMLEGSWDDLINDVTDFRIMMDLKKYSTGEYNGIDNVQLVGSSAPAPAPEPSTMILGALGAVGMLRNRRRKA